MGGWARVGVGAGVREGCSAPVGLVTGALVAVGVCPSVGPFALGVPQPVSSRASAKMAMSNPHNRPCAAPITCAPMRPSLRLLSNPTSLMMAYPAHGRKGMAATIRAFSVARGRSGATGSAGGPPASVATTRINGPNVVDAAQARGGVPSKAGGPPALPVGQRTITDRGLAAGLRPILVGDGPADGLSMVRPAVPSQVRTRP